MLTHFQCQTDGEEKVHRCILMRQKYVGGSRERDSERGGGGGAGYWRCSVELGYRVNLDI